MFLYGIDNNFRTTYTNVFLKAMVSGLSENERLSTNHYFYWSLRFSEDVKILTAMVYFVS